MGSRLIKEKKFAKNDNNTYLCIYFSNTILDWKVGRFAMSLVFGKRKKFQSLAGFELMACQNTGWATEDLVVNYYLRLVYTKTVDSVFRAVWLATQSVNNLHYSLVFTDSPPVPPSERHQTRVGCEQNAFPVCCRNKLRNFTTNQASYFRNTWRRWRSSVWEF